MSVRKNPKTIHDINKPERISKQKNLIEKVCANPNCQKKFIPSKRTQKYCCITCAGEGRKIELQNIKEKITKENLLLYCNLTSNITELAEKFNTSRTTIRKYLERFDLLEEFKSKFDFHAIPVLQFDNSGNLIKEWPSVVDAENTLHISHISDCCNNKRLSVGGYIWKYKE